MPEGRFNRGQAGNSVKCDLSERGSLQIRGGTAVTHGEPPLPRHPAAVSLFAAGCRNGVQTALTCCVA